MAKRWSVENLNDVVDKEFDALPNDIKAKFLYLAALIEELGLLALREPYVKHLQGKLWELRVKASAGIGRGLYCTLEGRRVIVLRYFQKKTDRTPKGEIVLAVQRMKEIDND